MGLKFLINLLYWERPNTIKNALNSIKDLKYDNWELVFLDDGSTKPGEPIVREILKDHLHKIKFVNTHQTNEDKFNNQSNFGRFMNAAIFASDADVVIGVCDDDALVDDYLNNLDKWFTDNPDKMWCYCHVVEYNPELQVVRNDLPRSANYWHNRYTGPIRPDGQLDFSQVAFRRSVFRTSHPKDMETGEYGNLKCLTEDDLVWQWPQTGCLDAGLFFRVWRAFGDVPFSGFTGQYKAVFPDQLGKRKDWSALPLDKVP